MAELLVLAKNHWQDSLSKEDIDKMTNRQKADFEARYQYGDIIVVRPDGWKWGTKECLPDFVIVKIPGVSVPDTKHLEESLFGTKTLDYCEEVDKVDWEIPIIKNTLLDKFKFDSAPVVAPLGDDKYLLFGTKTAVYPVYHRKFNLADSLIKDKDGKLVGEVIVEQKDTSDFISKTTEKKIF